MKKTFLTRRNALFTGGFSIGAYALLFVCIVLALRLVAPNAFWYLFTPAFHLSDTLAEESRSFFSSFENAATLARENESLTSENNTLILENKTLAQRLGAISGLSSDTAGIKAGVVARPPESAYDTLVLGEGTHAGVTLGMNVFGEGNTPLGIVSSVTADFSRVTLFSASGVSTSGWIGSKNFPITVVGAGGGVLTASVPRSLDIKTGDIVSVPGPGSLPVAVVTRVDSVASSPSVTLRLTPAVNLFSTTWVTLRTTSQ